MKKIYVKCGYCFKYETASSIGSIANIIPNNDDLEINIDDICDRYYCQCCINGIFFQIWCDDYKIEKIGE